MKTQIVLFLRLGSFALVISNQHFTVCGYFDSIGQINVKGSQLIYRFWVPEFRLKQSRQRQQVTLDLLPHLPPRLLVLFIEEFLHVLGSNFGFSFVVLMMMVIFSVGSGKLVKGRLWFKIWSSIADSAGVLFGYIGTIWKFVCRFFQVLRFFDYLTLRNIVVFNQANFENWWFLPFHSAEFLSHFWQSSQFFGLDLVSLDWSLPSVYFFGGLRE